VAEQRRATVSPNQWVKRAVVSGKSIGENKIGPERRGSDLVTDIGDHYRGHLCHREIHDPAELTSRTAQPGSEEQGESSLASRRDRHSFRPHVEREDLCGDHPGEGTPGHGEIGDIPVDQEDCALNSYIRMISPRRSITGEDVHYRRLCETGSPCHIPMIQAQSASTGVKERMQLVGTHGDDRGNTGMTDRHIRLPPSEHDLPTEIVDKKHGGDGHDEIDDADDAGGEETDGPAGETDLGENGGCVVDDG